jgi:hypothetical protein
VKKKSKKATEKAALRATSKQKQLPERTDVLEVFRPRYSGAKAVTTERNTASCKEKKRRNGYI